MKPTAHMMIDSTKSDSRRLKILEDLLYGSDVHEPKLLYPWEVVDLFQNDPPLGVYQEPERADNNLIARGRNYVLGGGLIEYYRTGERFPHTGEDVWGALKVGQGTPPNALRTAIEIHPGESYTLSCWVRVDPGVNVALRFYNREEIILAQEYQHDTQGEFVRMSTTYTRPPDMGTVLANVYLYSNLTIDDVSLQTYFTSPKLEYGTVATPWPPTPYSVSGYSDVEYATGTDLRGFKEDGYYTIHENSKLTEQGVGLYGL